MEGKPAWLLQEHPHPEPVGSENDEHIRRIAGRIPTIFVAWGAHGLSKPGSGSHSIASAAGSEKSPLLRYYQRWLAAPFTPFGGEIGSGHLSPRARL